MAGASQVRAGSAFVEILAKDGGLRKGLDAAGATLKRWGDGINALGQTFLKIGTAAIAPLVATSKVFSSMGDELAKASARTGVAVEELSALKYAAEQSGSDLAGLENGLRKMQKTLVDAARGSQGAKDALADLGLSVADLNGMRPDEQFKLIADRLSRIEDPAVKAGLAMEIFGKQGTSLIPLMAEGSAGINQLAEDAKRLGLVWSTEDAKAAEEFGDRLDDLWKVVKKGTADVGAALVPILREVALVVTDNVVKVNAWIRAHRETVQLALKVAAGVVAAGAAFVALGTGLSYVGTAVGGVSSAMGAVAGTVGTLAKLLSTVLFSGFGIAGLAAVWFGAYLLTTSERGKKALSALGGYFAGLKGAATDAISGVTAAIRAGDWSLALDVALTGLKLVWFQGIKPLEDTWTKFKGVVISVAGDAFYGVMSAWNTTYDALVKSWVTIGKVFGDIWAAVVKTIADSVGKIAGFTLQIGSLAFPEKYRKAFDFAGEAMKNGALSPSEKQLTDAAAAREKKANDAILEETKRFNAAKAKLDADAAAFQAGAATVTQEDLDKTAAHVESLRKRLDDLVGRAKNATPPDNKPPASPKFNPDDVAQGLDDLAKRTISVQGTFNSAALNALGGGSIPQQQLQELKQINRNTKSRNDILFGT